MTEARAGKRGISAACRAIAISAMVLASASCGSSVAGAREGSAAASIPSQAQGGVFTYRGDAARTGAMPGPAPAGTPAIAWTFKAGAPIGSSQTVVDGIVFLLGGDGVVHALTLESGEESWKAKLGADASASPLVAGGLVIVGDSMGIVHAISASDGSAGWTRATDGPISSAAAAAGNVAVVATTAGTAYAIDVATGGIRWTTRLAGPVLTSVAIAEDTAYVGAGPNLTALALADGMIRWQQAVSTSGKIGTPTVANGMVYTGIGLGGDDVSGRGVVALDTGTGAERWHYVSPADAVLYTPAVVDGRAYIVGEDRRVTAVDAAAGSVVWTTETTQVNEAVAAVADGLIFVAGNGGAMNALDATTGAIIWSVPYRGVPYGPTVVGGYVLVGTDTGTLVAIGGTAK